MIPRKKKTVKRAKKFTAPGEYHKMLLPIPRDRFNGEWVKVNLLLDPDDVLSQKDCAEDTAYPLDGAAMKGTGKRNAPKPNGP